MTALNVLNLGGGNSNIFYFYPDPWGNDPILTCAYFSNGLVKNHQLVNPVLRFSIGFLAADSRILANLE